ncbi:hypothetical protein [Bacillus solitudinis]|uniref:hypothetical protein n=1 Tax=Bacillus solitudinis TaxID=2014074 RepID=UPI0018E28AAD|nr:hypothetical protein [Bacillus solitudinis]
MKKNIIDLISPEMEKEINNELKYMKFTRNLRSLTADEWYIFLSNYKDPRTKGAAGKVIIHYDLQGNRDIFINTTVILEDSKLYNPQLKSLVYAIGDEVINRLVGYANTLLSLHAGENSYDAEYVK